jgi:hypothetical protein
MVTIIRYAQRIQYLYASFNNILVVSWRPFFLLARGSINTQRKRLIFRMPMSNDNRIVSSVNRTRQLYTGMHFHVISVFFLFNCRYHFKIRKFYFQGALAIARAVPSESYHYLVDAFPTLLIPQHGSETSAAFVLNIDNQFSRPFRAFKVKTIRIKIRIFLLPIKVPQGANNLIQ